MLNASQIVAKLTAQGEQTAGNQPGSSSNTSNRFTIDLRRLNLPKGGGLFLRHGPVVMPPQRRGRSGAHQIVESVNVVING